VENVRRVSLAEEEEPSIYGSLQQTGSSAGFLLIRSDLPTADVVDLASRAVRELDPELPFHTVTTMDAVVAESVDRERLLLALFGAFATVAALLAAFGVYSVVAYATARRLREMGIRASLGARPGDLLWSVVGRGMVPVALGTAAGVVAALAAADAMRGFVYGIGVRDPLSYGVVTAGLLLVAAVACTVPGRRAMANDPMRALRDS
jgi:putative ABC transport system permease protein